MMLVDGAAKNAAGATVNDVMMCLVSGCVRRYCDANGGGDIFKR